MKRARIEGKPALDLRRIRLRVMTRDSNQSERRQPVAMSCLEGDSAAQRSPKRVSVIVVNFNGGEMLLECLAALRRQTFSDFETIVVDNASSDGSDRAVRTQYPEVHLLRSEENLGFAGGNNLGWSHAGGSYIVLLNNDAVPDQDWLRELVDAIEESPESAAVTSKVVFLEPFVPLELRLESDNGRVSDDRQSEPSELLIDDASAFLDCEYEKPVFLRCSRSDRNGSQGRPLRRYGRESSLYLPVSETAADAVLKLIAATPRTGRSRQVTVTSGGRKIATVAIGEEPTEYLLEVSAAIVQAAAHDLINNAGSHLDLRGRARDRGIFEPDFGQFDSAEEVEAVCGTAVILRASALQKVGLFDPDFFMYFEDTDLSWRLRSNGFRLRYQPTARVRHHHAATSGEWSPVFTFYTARNRILMLAKNASIANFLATYLREIVRCGGSLLRGLLRRPALVPGRRFSEFGVRLRVQLSLLYQIPRALLKRMGVLRPVSRYHREQR